MEMDIESRLNKIEKQVSKITEIALMYPRFLVCLKEKECPNCKRVTLCRTVMYQEGEGFKCEICGKYFKPNIKFTEDKQ